MIERLHITAGPFTLSGRLELEQAPRTCAAFVARLPFEQKLVHVRWSGEASWIPLGDLDFALGPEHATSHPAPGEVLLYPGPLSETEILVPYGPTLFSSVVGQLAGNHFLTIDEGLEHLRPLGVRTLWEGAQPIRFTAA